LLGLSRDIAASKAATVGFAGAAAALFASRRTRGRGRGGGSSPPCGGVVDVSYLRTGCVLLALTHLMLRHAPTRAQLFATAPSPQRMWAGAPPMANVFRTSDGQWVQVYALAGGASGTHPLVDLYRAVGLGLPALGRNAAAGAMALITDPGLRLPGGWHGARGMVAARELMRPMMEVRPCRRVLPEE
jgi:hypothetical protein